MTLADISLPTADRAIDDWLAVLALSYFVVSEFVHRIRDWLVKEYQLPHNLVFRDVFDGLVFANSVMLFLSFFQPAILNFLDHSHIYVLVASFLGFYLVFKSLWPPIKAVLPAVDKPQVPGGQHLSAKDSAS